MQSPLLASPPSMSPAVAVGETQAPAARDLRHCIMNLRMMTKLLPYQSTSWSPVWAYEYHQRLQSIKWIDWWILMKSPVWVYEYHQTPESKMNWLMNIHEVTCMILRVPPENPESKMSLLHEWQVNEQVVPILSLVPASSSLSEWVLSAAEITVSQRRTALYVPRWLSSNAWASNCPW